MYSHNQDTSVVEYYNNHQSCRHSAQPCHLPTPPRPPYQPPPSPHRVRVEQHVFLLRSLRPCNRSAMADSERNLTDNTPVADPNLGQPPHKECRLRAGNYRCCINIGECENGSQDSNSDMLLKICYTASILEYCKNGSQAYLSIYLSIYLLLT